MRIAHIIDSLDWGGAQRLLVTFAEAANEENISLTIILLDKNSGDAPFFTELGDWNVLTVVFHAQRLLNPIRFAKLFWFLKREQFDLVHTHLNYGNILGSMAGKLSGIPVVATLHNMRVSKSPTPRKKLERWVLHKMANRLIVVGQQVAKARKHQFPGKTLHVVPNAVSSIPPMGERERLAVRTELIGDPSRPLLITVGRLNPLKGVDDLLTAFARVYQTHPRATLIIVGDGSILPDLAKQIKTLELENNVWLLGGRSDVPRLLAASDLYVSASHWEGLPVAMLEAMSAGLPVAATGVGDVPVVLTSQTGVVVPPKEPVRLAEAIIQLLDNYEHLPTMGAAARAHVTRHYNTSVWLNKLLDLYQDTISPDTAVTTSEI